MALFSNQNLPLSKRMMPKNFEEFIGQSHLTAQGKPIYSMLANKIIHSMIFYGPPATGKTSLAELIASQMEYSFVRTNALTLDIDEIRSILTQASQRALSGNKTIVFIDEIHRLMKPKQDAFLSSLENGEVIIIGATTENPYFVIQPAFRSRLFIYEFKNHSAEELEKILEMALQKDRLLKGLEIEFPEDSRKLLIESTNDARRLLNTLEIIILSKSPGQKTSISRNDILQVLQQTDTKYSDKEGHYDVISAFIKSVRGSDINAAIYYLAFMLHSGEDPLFIARRLIILAAEDIGLAYPEGLSVAVACYDAIEKIGMPEGRIVLAQTTALLAGVPKSNSAYLAIDKALADIQNGNVMNVPSYLRGSNFSGAKDLGRGTGYQYPHDYENHFVGQKYTEKEVSYYQPGGLGFEKKIAEWMKKLKP
jgi:putative ATPase